MNSKKSKTIIQVIKMMSAFAAYRSAGCTARVNGKKIWALANLLCAALLATHLNRAYLLGEINMYQYVLFKRNLR